MPPPSAPWPGREGVFHHLLLLGLRGNWREGAIHRHRLLLGLRGNWREGAIHHLLLLGLGGNWREGVFHHLVTHADVPQGGGWEAQDGI